jgi:hypothetical protein
MGDRANVYVQDEYNEEKGVYLYTHSFGDELPFVVQKALSRKLRWDDGSYLARIIFCEMVKDDIEGELGYGISAERVGDNHKLITVQPYKQLIKFGDDDSWRFSEYIELAKEEIEKNWE